jgi:hypothetical protein
MPHDAPAPTGSASRPPDLDPALTDLLDAAVARGFDVTTAGRARRFARVACPGCQDEWCVPLRPWVAGAHLRRLRAYLAIHDHSMSTTPQPASAVAAAPASRPAPRRH